MPTILELFKSRGLDKSVKAEKETLIEQETSGIRVKSAVELNNPLLYGNEALRIVNRSTSTLESMKGATGGQEGDGGLIGQGLSKVTDGKVGSITQARDAVNSKLGIPITPNPSRLVGDIEKISTSEPITKDSVGDTLQGTGLGSFLKETGGGNPKTIGKQAVGKGVGLAKDKLRGALFGEPQGIGTAQSEKESQINYTIDEDGKRYSDQKLDLKTKKGDELLEELNKTKLDLSKVSPIYGVRRAGSSQSLPGKFGSTEYGFETDGDYAVQSYSPSITYTKNEDGSPSAKSKASLANKYGLVNGGDTLNLIGKDDYDSIDEYGRLKKGDEIVGQDLIPFHIGKVGDKKTPFRAIMTGISENVSPSWNSNKMLGNPFPFYTYNQIERNLTFTLSIVCGNPLELSKNWEKIEELTKMAYPSINKSKLVNPPIIQFRLGDLYYNKHGFIESLSYTIPDNGTWETDGDVGYLPKFIEASITIKFIEDTSVLGGLYGYKKSKAAIEKLKEEQKANSFSESNRTGTVEVGQGQFGEFGTDNFETKVTVTKRGIASLEDSLSIPNPKSLVKGLNVSTPKNTEDSIDSSIKSQSAIADKLEGKTPTEAIKDAESKNNINPLQARNLVYLKAQYSNFETISKNQLSKIAQDSLTRSVFDFKWDISNAIYFKGETPDYSVEGIIKNDGYSNDLAIDRG